MAESILIRPGSSKEEVYQQLIPQIQSLVSGEKNLTSNLANIAAALKEAFKFFWVGFYLVEGNQLVLGPFQGPVACTRIGYGKGVCGSSWQRGETIIVPDVEQFPGHIACSSASKSEIVVPCFKEGKVVLILDVDSDALNQFDETDSKFLQELMAFVSHLV